MFMSISYLFDSNETETWKSGKRNVKKQKKKTKICACEKKEKEDAYDFCFFEK